MTGLSRLALFATAALLLGGAASAGDTPLDEGHGLVTMYCADCHAVERTGESKHPAAPPFRTLNQRYNVEWLSEALVEGLVSGHPDMPEFEFDPLQAEAIVTYLKSISD